MSRSTSIAILIGTAMATALGLALLDPIPQDPVYHSFCDTRAWLGIPNAGDVLSNLPFLFVGVYGLLIVRRHGRRWGTNGVPGMWAVFFAGIAMVSVGSAYYHLAPDNPRLVWDRLPMTVGFMALFTAVIAERVSLEIANRSLIPLLIIGALSVLYWEHTELKGYGDLRPYIMVQLYPLMVIPLVLWLFEAKYSRGADLLVALGFYGLAKVCELGDATIYDTGEIISGHTLKHLLAAVGCYWVARMLALRKPVSSANQG